MPSQIAIARESERVKRKVRAAGWTFASLALELGYSRPHISNILAGRDRPRGVQQLIALKLGEEPRAFWGGLWYEHAPHETEASAC